MEYDCTGVAIALDLAKLVRLLLPADGGRVASFPLVQPKGAFSLSVHITWITFCFNRARQGPEKDREVILVQTRRAGYIYIYI